MNIEHISGQNLCGTLRDLRCSKKKTNSCGDSWNGSLGWSWMRTKSQAFKSGIVYSQCEVDKIAKANNKSLPGSTTHGFCGLSKLGASWSFIMLYRIGFTTNE